MGYKGQMYGDNYYSYNSSLFIYILFFFITLESRIHHDNFQYYHWHCDADHIMSSDSPHTRSCMSLEITLKATCLVDNIKGGVDDPAGPANAGPLSETLRIAEALFTVRRMSPRPLRSPVYTVMLQLY